MFDYYRIMFDYGIEHRVSYSARNEAKSFFFDVIAKFETQGCQWYEVKQIKSIFADKGNVEQGLGLSLLPTSTSSYFFISYTKI